ncbi:MAG: YHS domain protein [Rhizobacter sp.]|nr:YHS domain protein [Ferruginibacter sp.]
MKIIFLISCYCLVFSTATLAQDKTALRQKQFNISAGNPAIKGYDPVAYFIQQKPAKGKKELAWTQEGILYYFSSAQNREIFKKNPAIYEPQYGGWCAYAMGATGEKVNIDPETFKILNGRLFLFYNKFFNNTLKSWNKDENQLNKKADANWLKFFR